MRGERLDDPPRARCRRVRYRYNRRYWRYECDFSHRYRNTLEEIVSERALVSVERISDDLQERVDQFEEREDTPRERFQDAMSCRSDDAVVADLFSLALKGWRSTKMEQSTDSDEDDKEFPPEKRLEAPNHRLIETGIAAIPDMETLRECVAYENAHQNRTPILKQLDRKAAELRESEGGNAVNQQ